MSTINVRIGGKTASLSRRIGRGGEGDVYLVNGEPSIAVKIYTLKNLDDRPAKIRALVEAKLAEKEPLVAFPIAEVRSDLGVFLGFTMRLVDGCKPLHELYAPGARKIHFPQADFRFLVRTAANVARAVAAVHRNGCVIGDINHSGILVSPKAMVSLIDADSFQVSTQTGKYLCKVGVPEYTPPELQGGSLVGVTRTPNHDAFGLAVVIFQLLFMGRHPFVGTVRRGDIPPIHENIAARRYVYTDRRNVGMDQPPGTPSISDFSPSLADAFDEAFLGDRPRPTAENWVRVLDSLEQSLVKCQDNELHFIPKDAPDCAWCDMERQLGTVLFLPFSNIPLSSTASSGDNFNVDAIWRTIQAIQAATTAGANPTFPNINVSPSEAAQKAKTAQDGNWNITGIGIIVFAVLGLLAAPKAIILWGILFLIGFRVAKDKPKIDPTPFTSSYIASEQLYQRELANWHKRNGSEEYLRLLKELESARDEYLLVKKLEILEVGRQGEQRKEAQLNAYLDTFPIELANIKGIGPATRLTLASYGIDTAADIQLNRLSAVRGIGSVYSERLMAWRKKLESQFVYRPSLSTLDQAAILQAKVKAEAKAAPLRVKLLAGPQQLNHLAIKLRQASGSADAILSKARQAKEQAKCDLDFLGISVPHVPASVPSTQPSYRPTSSSRNSPTFTPTTSSPTSVALTCPRCGSSMIKRLARKGRNAGNYFWGCSRYPTCKGTRNI